MKRNIIFFIDSLTSGGAQRQIVTLASNINKEKYNPTVLIYHDLMHYADILDAAEIPIVRIPKKHYIDPVFFFKVVSFFKKNKTDIILSYLNTPNMWARLAGTVAGIQCIITSERNTKLTKPRIRFYIERILHPLSDKIVVNASVTADLLKEKLKVPSSKIHIIYNGIDASFKLPPDTEIIKKLKNRFNISNKDRVITLPGRICEQKNHIALVKAFIEISKIKPEVKLLFVGQIIDKKIEQEIIQQLDINELCDRVIFSGQINDMKEIYALSDIVVLPSLWEGFPNVVLEAMAIGRPIIASDISDNGKLISHRKTGWLFDSGDQKSLAKILISVLDMDKNDLSKVCSSAKIHIQNNFSVNSLITNYEILFEELI